MPNGIFRTVGERGQITIPKKMREQLEIGEVVWVCVKNGKIVIGRAQDKFFETIERGNEE